MDEAQERKHRWQVRAEENQAFLTRLYTRRPELREKYETRLESTKLPLEAVLEADFEVSAVGESGPVETTNQAPPAHMVALETIVSEERPVLFVRDDWIDSENASIIGFEAEQLVHDLNSRRDQLAPLMPLVGRIDVTSFPNIDYVGTGWCIDTDIVVTNRHVASLIARRDGAKFTFARGVGGIEMTAAFNILHEFDDLRTDKARVFAVTELLYIEPEPGPDIAFLRIRRTTDGSRRDRLNVAKTDIADNKPVFVVGYPARASRRIIPDQRLMQRLYLDRYDIKRAAPGYSMMLERGSVRHDCTSLGGNSGSPVFDMINGDVIGLHFAGLYEEANYAVPASVLTDYISRKAWTKSRFEVETSQPPRGPQHTSARQPLVSHSVASSAEPAVATNGGAVTVTIPLSITVSLGQPVTTSMNTRDNRATATRDEPALSDLPGAEAAVKAFWRQRPDGVVATRVGFEADGDAVGDMPCIVASAPFDVLDAVQTRGPNTFHGLTVHYVLADVTEQIDGVALAESVDSIAYDDDARTGQDFSFAEVDEIMTVRAHVGPEYSWDELKVFLDSAEGSLVSAIYEFHAPQIKNAIEARLATGADLTLVCDNVTYSAIRDDEEEFDRVAVFRQWQEKFGARFKRIVPPEGKAGLISDAYHIKVTVREDDAFWLSSGNWKKGSSQPEISDEQRANAGDIDLPGNREWHVIIRNSTLANRFRHHILQDFKRSELLGGGAMPKTKEAADDIFVDILIEEGPIEERPPASRLLKPRLFDRRMKVKPLLTPDQEGAVYSEAVLDLINNAKKRLLFQIPYIAMPSDPTAYRGYIDDLLSALTSKLLSLDDARVILRSGGSKFSAPTHAAWYFKSKGVDIDNRVRQIENHHTKGMIVDGRRVLIGSHNWSKPGVTLNRDASLIFDDVEVAGYYAEAFEIDWQRARPIRSKEYRKPVIVKEAVGDAPALGFRRIRLSELLKEDG